MALTRFNSSARTLNAATSVTDDVLAAWAETIPMDGLWDKLRAVTGLDDLSFTSKIEQRRGNVSIRFKSQNLADRTGFLKLMFDELCIEEFNSEVTCKDTGAAPAHNYYWWGTASFQYHHPSGGSNGYRFLSFQYTEGEGWTFRKEG